MNGAPGVVAEGEKAVRAGRDTPPCRFASRMGHPVDVVFVAYGGGYAVVCGD